MDAKNINKKILILIPPYTPLKNLVPLPGPALLKPVLEQQGFEVKIIDTTPDFHINTEFPLAANKNLKGMDFSNIFGHFAGLSLDEYIENMPDVFWSELKRIRDEIISYDPDILGFSVPFRPSLLSAFWLAREVKTKTNCKTVIGGGLIQPDLKGLLEKMCPPDTIDAFVFGEGEITFPALAKHLTNGSSTTADLHAKLRTMPGVGFFKETNNPDLHVNFPGEPPQNLDSLPFADLSDYEHAKYPANHLPLTLSRGCIARCWFCNHRRIHAKFRMRSPENILKEVEEKYERTGYHRFYITDNLTNGDHRKLMDFCKLVVKRGLPFKFRGMPRLTRLFTEEDIKLFVEAGFNDNIIALESGSESVRVSMGKYGNQKHVSDIIHWLVKYGSKVMLYIMHSYPTETEKDFQLTMDFLDQFTPDQITWGFWPFRLDAVKIGAIDQQFVQHFGITVTRVGDFLPGHWLFLRDHDWHNENINEDVRNERHQALAEFEQHWLAR